jgi:hypothetical protein
MYDPNLNPLTLKPKDFTKLFDNCGYFDMVVESCERDEIPDHPKYAAIYTVVFKDDGSFLEEKSREGTVYIEFTPNGTLFASL